VLSIGLLLASEVIRFAGVAVPGSPKTLLDQFPKSIHELHRSGQPVIILRDQPERFRTEIGTATGAYHVRVTATEVRNNVHFIRATLDGGKLTEAALSFEDDRRRGSFITRHPRCAAVSALIRQLHGAHTRVTEHVEEALRHHIYEWTNAAGKLTLDCATSGNQRTQYALELTITSASKNPPGP
jgi:hypothetical protein